MKPDELKDLEKDVKFKRKHLPNKFWLNILIVPPSCILFLALFGLLYLFNYEMLLSYYSIPFVVLLVIGTIWLKAIRNHIFDVVTKKEHAFYTCYGKIVESTNKELYVVFSLDSNRHNRYFIEKVGKQLNEKYESDYFIHLLSNEDHKGTLVPEYENAYIRKISKNKIPRKFKLGNSSGLLSLLYIDCYNMLIIDID